MQLAPPPGLMEGALECGGAVLEWTLALYVVARGGWRRVPVLTALAIATLAVYQLGNALGVLAPDEDTGMAWVRYTWVGPAVLPALWLVLTAALVAEEGPAHLRPGLRRAFETASILGLGLGLFFAAGSFTDLIRNWEPATYGDGEVHYSAPGPLYPLYLGYMLICALWGAANVALLWRASAPGTPLRAAWRSLVFTAVFFLGGGAYLGATAGRWPILTANLYSSLIGHALLLAGMLVMGWAMARYGALLAGEVVAGDFIAYAAAMAAVVGTYGVVFFALLPHDYFWLERAVPLLLLLMATHVLAGGRDRLWLERVLYGQVRGTLRDQLRLLAARVVRQPDPLSALVEVRESVASLVRVQGAALEAASTPTVQAERTEQPAQRTTPAAVPGELRVLTEGALRHLNDLPALSQHPLLDLLVPAAGEASAPTVLERARQLREEMVQAIARLRPPGARPNPGAQAGAGGWLHFLVLHEAYVEGRPNKEVMQRYYLSEGTFHRSRRRAVDALALDLHQRQPAEVPATI